MAQSYVNTASTPGGNGTTNATSGANRAYASLSEWEAARQGVLADIEVVDCSGSTADTASCTIDGSTTTSSFYHRIRAASGQEATMPWSTSRYRLSVNGNVLLIQDDHVRVERIQLETIDTSSNRTVVYIPNANAKIIKCLVRYGTSNQHVGLDFRNGGIAENTVCIGNGVAGALGFTSTSGSGTMHWYNCTAIGCGVNFDFQGTTTVLKNCLSHGATADATSDYVGTFGAGSTNNASEDATASGTNARASQTFTFVNAGTGDYHLAAGDAGAKDFGTSLAADGVWPFSTDFDGATRSGSWDIGADEVAGAATTDGAFSSSGVGAAAFTGAATAAGVAASAGAAAVAFTGRSTAASALASSGSAAVAFTGAATAASALTSAGAATAQFTGASIAAGVFSSAGVATVAFSNNTITSGAFAAGGAGAAAFVGTAIAAGVMSSAGVGSASFTGNATAAGAFASAGVGALAGVGSSTATSVFTSAGVGLATFVGNDASVEINPSQTADPFARSRTHTAIARTFAWTAPERD